MNADTIKFRCSSLDKIMPSDKARGQWTETQLTELIKIFAAQEGRKESIDNKFLAKGNEREEDSITLLSRVTKQLYFKNEVQLSNDYLTGTPDLFQGTKIEIATEITDTKTSWSRITHLKAKAFDWSTDYKWQMQGYMALTGAEKATVAFCLVNGTAKAINDEKRKASYHSEMIDYNTDPKYKAACKQIEINHIFDIEHFAKENLGYDFENDLKIQYFEDGTVKVEGWSWDIPMEKRLFLFDIKRDQEAINKIQSRITDCRQWINTNLCSL